MYCSNKQFLNIAHEVGVKHEDLSSLLQVIFALSKKYGSLLKSYTLQEVIGNTDARIGTLLKVLQKLDKLYTKDIHEMVDVLNKVSDQHSFDIISPLWWDALQTLSASLEGQFDGTQIKNTESKKIELQVSGGGRYYKRSLKRDLDKLLK